MQRKILPFLTEFFPRVQFIVSTHSPYILTSVSNATIFDLEKKVTFNDMSNYSIDNVAEAYFDSEDYFDNLKPIPESKMSGWNLQPEYKALWGKFVSEISDRRI